MRVVTFHSRRSRCAWACLLSVLSTLLQMCVLSQCALLTENSMYNFNHERFYVSVCCNRLARICLEESLKYALRRKTWGKTLSEHQSIRMKIAAMARSVEQMQTWLEFIAYQVRPPPLHVLHWPLWALPKSVIFRCARCRTKKPTASWAIS